MLQIVLCQCIKVFYCFDNLLGIFVEVFGKLNWCFVCQGGKLVVEVFNDIVFYVFLVSVKLKVGNVYYVVDVDMVVLKLSC